MSAANRSAGMPTPDSALVTKWKESLKGHSNRKEWWKLISKVTLFSGGTDVFRQGLCDVMFPAEYEKGQVLFQKGDLGDWLGVVIQGHIDKEVPLSDDSTSFIGDAYPGSVVGELCGLGILLSRSYSARAGEPTTVLVLTRIALQDFVRQLATPGHPSPFPLLEEAQAMSRRLADRETFRNLECFWRMGKDFVSELADHFTPQLFLEGTAIMRQNSIGQEMYLLQVGTAAASRDDKPLDEYRSGQVLGELAVLGKDKRRPFTVICKRHCLVYSLQCNVFSKILSKYPDGQKILDHEYICRHLSYELLKVKDEVKSLNFFYGKAHPLTNLQLFEDVYGNKVEEQTRRASNTRSSNATNVVSQSRQVTLLLGSQEGPEH